MDVIYSHVYRFSQHELEKLRNAVEAELQFRVYERDDDKFRGVVRVENIRR